MDPRAHGVSPQNESELLKLLSDVPRSQAAHLLASVNGTDQLVAAATKPAIVRPTSARQRRWEPKGHAGAVAKIQGRVPHRYLQELLLLAARRRAIYPPQCLNAEQRLRNDHDIGLPAGHPLVELRRRVVANYNGVVAPVVPLIVWGASQTTGPILYQELGVLLRDRALFLSVFECKWELLRDWVNWSGVHHAKSLHAAHALIQSSFYASMALPNRAVPAHKMDGKGFAQVDSRFTEWVMETAKIRARSLGWDERKTARFVYQAWRCCSRIAAYAQNNCVYWRAEWLRGKATLAPIPGASTFAAELTKFLKRELFDPTPVKKHSAGRAATIYRLRYKFGVGVVDRRLVARRLGLTLNDNGSPRRR